MHHDEARKRVCFSCFRKVKANENLSESSDLIIKRVQEFIPNLDLQDDCIPIGFCGTCRRKLQVAESLSLTNLSKFLATQKRTSPRAECKCFVCEIASASGLQAKKHQKKHTTPKGRSSKKEEEIVHRLCGKCYSPLYSCKNLAPM